MNFKKLTQKARIVSQLAGIATQVVLSGHQREQAEQATDKAQQVISKIEDLGNLLYPFD